MNGALLKATNEIDVGTGFRCLKTYLKGPPDRNHCHDYYEVFLTLSEGVVHIINGKEEILPKGALVFIRKEDTHSFRPNSSDESSMINIAFTQEIIENLFTFLSDSFPSYKLLKAPNPPMVILDSINIKKLLSKLDTINTVPINDYKNKSLGYKKLLVSIFCEYFSDYPFEKKVLLIPLWLKEFDKKMKKIEYFSLPNDEIAKISGKSKEYLSRSVRKYFNLSFSEYVNDVRLNFVANSLTNTDLPITQLFYDSGFENLSYAYVLFKKKFGTTPKLMREIKNNGLV